MFDTNKHRWQPARDQLAELAGQDGMRAASRTTINAHYTHPELVQQMWSAVTGLGFTGGKVLEPGSGIGTFIAKAPATATMTGIELDPSTAKVSAALHPQATIRSESFADTRLPRGSFDAVIGNVPFANVTLHDPHFNRSGHSMHNHFIIKSLELTKPGGVVAVLTSRYTMDAQNPSARLEMAKHGELLAAVRLPTGAHQEMAGTQAVTDLLILRKHDSGSTDGAHDAAWLQTAPLEVDGQQLPINTYWHDNPHHVLGDMRIGTGMHGSATLNVTTENLHTVPEQLHTALAPRIEAAVREGRGWNPANVAAATPAARLDPPTSQMWDGHITHTSSGFLAANEGQWEDVKVPKTHSAELRSLLRLRDDTVHLIERESSSNGHDPATEDARDAARRSYERYTDKYGPLNRFNERNTGRVNDDGDTIYARVLPTAVRIFDKDPQAAVVFALEDYDAGTGTASPADILHRRVIEAPVPVTRTDSPSEALNISLNTHGRADLPVIARLLDTDTDDARARLGDLVFDDPQTGTLETATTYLSGNVRAKLSDAQHAAAQDPRYTANVHALRDVQPQDLGMDEIHARLGASWIDADTHQDFLRDVLNDPGLKVEHSSGNMWAVDGKKYSVEATSTWGTDRRPAPALAQSILEQREILVFDTDEEGRRHLNADASAAAQEKATALQERFGDWVWEEPDRAARLHQTYNQRFNSLRLPDYSADGQRLTFPGLADHFTPRDHQRAAVARMVTQQSTGLFHEVGAGKTAAMAMGATELKRLGLVNKPVVVVPNHMLRQFRSEWLELYPQANILAGGRDDLAPANRKRFVARAATHDWDAVIITHSAFQRLPVRTETETAYRDKELEALRAELVSSQSESGLSVKRLERKLLAKEEQSRKLLAKSARDPGLTFEATGIDYIIYDEAHGCKNLSTNSNIPGADIAGSGKASDLHMKLDYLRSNGQRHVATLATATPIANSVTEAHVMLRYLAPDLLQQSQTEHFDTWAATFGQANTELELGVEGGGVYRPKTRLSRFQNVPEMLTMVHAVADVKTADDLNLPTPDITARADGQHVPEVITVPADEDLDTYIQHLANRADEVRAGAVDPKEDNLLKISTDGRAAALDVRLVKPNADPGPQNKISVAADHIHATWIQHKDQTYLGDDRQPHPTPGALQLVFADQGTPNPNRAFDAYNELKTQLVSRGMPAEQVRFIHEADSPTDKARLFAAARSGDVAVLVGSTQKMGVGTNVQNRIAAIHHLDAPWRPADVAQRNGRGIRQGNQHETVDIKVYVTERSFDAFMWQGLERKSKFVNSFMKGNLDVREINDLGGESLSFAEVKALASGDPLILDKAQADQELAKYERLERSWARNQTNLRGIISHADATITRNERLLPTAQQAAANVRPTAGDSFSATINNRTYTKRTQAAAAIQAQLSPHRHNARWLREPVELGHLITLGGQHIHAKLTPGNPPQLTAWVRDLPATTKHTPLANVINDANGLIRSSENQANKVKELPAELQTQTDEARIRKQAAATDLTKPFKHQAALTQAQQEVQRIAKEMNATNADDKTTTPAATATGRTDDLNQIRNNLAQSRRYTRSTSRTGHDEPHPSQAPATQTHLEQ